MALLSMEQLEELRKFDSPTICNAIERFNIRPKTEGFMSSDIKAVLHYDKSFIGYACTAKVSAAKQPTPEQAALAMKYYAKLQATPRPSIAVIQDIDPRPIGSFWGEVQSTVHKSLGCVATITNGGVRDLNEVGPLGFGYFASCLLVSHAYIHTEDYDCPVEVFGLKVNPGDLIFADKHGAVSIPNEIAHEMIDACRKIAAAELPVLEGCRRAILEGKEVDLDELKRWREEMGRLRVAK